MFDPKDTLSRLSSIRNVLIRLRTALPPGVPEVGTYQRYIDTTTALIGLMRGQSYVDRLIHSLQRYQDLTGSATIAHVDLFRLISELPPVNLRDWRLGQVVRLTDGDDHTVRAKIVTITSQFIEVQEPDAYGNFTGHVVRLATDGTSNNGTHIDPL